MAVVDLATLRARVLRAVSMTATDISTADLDAHINGGLQELDDLLQDELGQDYFRQESSITLAAAPYTLAANFYRLLSLHLDHDGTWQKVERIAEGEEAALLNSRQDGLWPWGMGWRYRLATAVGTGNTTGPTTITLLPLPDTSYAAKLAYQPQRPLLALVTDTVDYPKGWEEFAVQEAARRIAQDEDAPTERFELALAKQRTRITKAVPKRQASEPVHPPQTGRRQGYTGRWS